LLNPSTPQAKQPVDCFKTQVSRFHGFMVLKAVTMNSVPSGAQNFETSKL